MDQNLNAKIKKSQDELDPVLNFLRDPDMLSPESPAIKIDGRENFFGDFHEEQMVYHVVENWDEHELKCYVLIPKSLKLNEKITFHVLFHGGGMATGGGNTLHWWCDYKLDLAINANAITLIPMYRLMPETRGPAIYEDINNWWKFYASERCDQWVQKRLENYGMQAGIKNLSKKHLLVSGESAGGLLAVYSWLSSPNADIRALFLQYPVLNYYERELPKDFLMYMGKPIEVKYFAKRWDDIQNLVNKQDAENRLVSRSDTKTPYGMTAAVLLSNLKKWEGWFRDERLPPQKQAKDAPGLLKSLIEENKKPVSFPAIFIVHGSEDPAVPVANSRAYCEKLKDAFQRWNHHEQPHFEVVQGASHGFDYVVKGKPFQGQINNLMQNVTTAWCK